MAPFKDSSNHQKDEPSSAEAGEKFIEWLLGVSKIPDSTCAEAFDVVDTLNPAYLVESLSEKASVYSSAIDFAITEFSTLSGIHPTKNLMIIVLAFEHVLRKTKP